METAIVYGNVFVEGHKPWRPHPESPARLRRIISSILRHGLKDRVLWFKPVSTSKETLYKVHVKGYVDYVEKLVTNAPAEIDPDTYVVRDSMDTALYAYGSAIEYSLKAFTENKAYILLCRPPGHHAGREGKAMGAPTQGFCIFNNIAGAIENLLDHGLTAIAVIDFDAHHGNGTQEIFYREDKVLHIDIHQDPSTLYPYTGYPGQVGEGRGEGYTVNIVLPPMAGDDCFLEVIDIIHSIITQYDPEIVMVSAGFDGYNGDGLTELRYSTKTFYSLGRLLDSLGKPVFVTLEGGYTSGLERGFPAFLAGLLDVDNPVREKPTGSIPLIKKKAEKMIRETVSIINSYWRIK